MTLSINWFQKNPASQPEPLNRFNEFTKLSSLINSPGCMQKVVWNHGNCSEYPRVTWREFCFHQYDWKSDDSQNHVLKLSKCIKVSLFAIIPLYTPKQTWPCGLSGGQRVLWSIHIQLRKGVHYLSRELLDTLYMNFHFGKPLCWIRLQSV